MDTPPTPARLELELQVGLYKFYLDCYLKGIALFLAIAGALLKFAVDSPHGGRIFAYAGLGSSLSVVVPLLYGVAHARRFARDFARLGALTGSRPISVGPFYMFIAVSALFLSMVIAGWAYLVLEGGSLRQ